MTADAIVGGGCALCHIVAVIAFLACSIGGEIGAEIIGNEGLMDVGVGG